MAMFKKKPEVVDAIKLSRISNKRAVEDWLSGLEELVPGDYSYEISFPRCPDGVGVVTIIRNGVSLLWAIEGSYLVANGATVTFVSEGEFEGMYEEVTDGS